MDLLAGGKLHLQIQLIDDNCLPAETLDINLNAAGVCIIESRMFESAQIKISIQLAINTRQDIQIKSCRHTQRVVVCCLEHRPVLLQIRAQQKRVSFIQHSPHCMQKFYRFFGIKVADVGTEE